MQRQELTTRQGRIFPYMILVGDLVVITSVLKLFCHFGCSPFLEYFPSHQLYIVSSLVYLLAASKSQVILHHRTVRSYQIVTNIFNNCFIYGCLLMLVHFLSYNAFVTFKLFFFYLACVFLSVSMYRIVIRKIVKTWRTKGGNIRHVVLVGDKHNSVQLYNEITSDPSTGFRVHGYFADRPCADYPEGCTYLGKPSEVIDWLKNNTYVQQLFCSLPSAQKDVIVPIINYCENNLVHFYSLPNLYNYMQHTVYFNHLGTVPFLSLRQDPLLLTENRFIKRLFDIIVSGIFLCTLFPVILLIVVVITKITMPGPIFFKQKRNGLNDEEFYCYKFRSMKVNEEADTLQATKEDSRKTKWGNIMRKTSLDELPQFINVLKGDMSVVGPRPHMLKHTEEYSRLIDKYMVRHFVKPGVTGWAQVTGFRGETKELKDMEGRILADIWYIEHWSFWLDIYIIYKTLVNVIQGDKNAY